MVKRQQTKTAAADFKATERDSETEGFRIIGLEFPEARLAAFDKGFTRLQKCYQRNDFPVPSMTILGRTFRTEANGMSVAITRLEIEACMAPSVNNWRAVAVMYWTPEGNIIEPLNPDKWEAEPVPARYRSNSLIDHCDECPKKQGTNRSLRRNRKQAVLLHNTVSDVWAQVGSGCLAKYLGACTATHIFSLLKFRTRLFKLVRDPALVRPITEGEYTGVSTLPLLAHVVASIRSKRWNPRTTGTDALGRFRLDARQSAANMAAEYAGEPTAARPYQPEDGDRKVAREALAWALNLTDAVCEDNDTMGNIRTIATNEQVSDRDVKWAAELVRAYQRTQQQAVATERRAASAYIADVGDSFVERHRKVSGKRVAVGRVLPALVVQVEAITSRPGYWNPRVPEHHVRLRDDQGNLAIWCAPNQRALDSSGFYEGGTYLIKGTVKAHAMSNGETASILLYAEVVGEPDVNRLPQDYSGPSDVRELEIRDDAPAAVWAPQARTDKWVAENLTRPEATQESVDGCVERIMQVLDRVAADGSEGAAMAFVGAVSRRARAQAEGSMGCTLEVAVGGAFNTWQDAQVPEPVYTCPDPLQVGLYDWQNERLLCRVLDGTLDAGMARDVALAWKQENADCILRAKAFGPALPPAPASAAVRAVYERGGSDALPCR